MTTNPVLPYAVGFNLCFYFDVLKCSTGNASVVPSNVCLHSTADIGGQ